ncbi:hypothetical protein FIBSPDRAFT_847414 [Athelia psychrophila]|uniref:Uncharacterized protein n=1 Tax=Athelia psychrophila TaxID=1759441 RepID=A0A165Z2E8_9AGAM|nr:hypothetical protein FIBSPDRAFT_872904 [Fibularhizoctonia sp. CBS 109695]KZP33488.1 hypothetical protein FIBSPDRAFT_847414 [Fibularhizoctonia sp. CBS 109695]
MGYTEGIEDGISKKVVYSTCKARQSKQNELLHLRLSILNFCVMHALAGTPLSNGRAHPEHTFNQHPKRTP